MKEILEFRTQIFRPKLPEKINQLSGVEILNFHEEDISLPQILLAYSISSDELFESDLISKLIKDVFHDYFFKKEVSTNKQTAEEAILNVKQKLIKILKSSEKNKLDFNLICGIFYENNLSIVKYGKTYATIVRDGVLKNLEFASEGYFGSAQGNVKSSDVLIFSTEEFFNKFINQELLSKSLKVDEDDLSPLSTSLIFMFYKSASQPVKSTINNNSKKIVKKSQKFLKKHFTKILILIAIFSISGIYVFYNKYQEEKNKSSFDLLVKNTEEILSLDSSNRQENSNKIIDQIKVVNESNLPNKEELITQLKQKYNEVNNIKERQFKILFDFKEQNPRVNLKSMIYFNESVYVLDLDTSKIFTSKLSELKFDSTEISIENPKYMDFFTKTIVISNEKKYQFYSTDLIKNANEFTFDSIGVFKTYMNFIYEIDGNKIYRIDANAEQGKKDLWAESNDIVDAKDLSIDVDIFVLDKNSKLLKYSRGAKQEINFENNEFNFTKMVVSTSNKFNYFISENKLFVYTKDGKLDSVYSDTSFTEKFIDFTVLNDKRIILISNSKLVEINL